MLTCFRIVKNISSKLFSTIVRSANTQAGVLALVQPGEEMTRLLRRGRLLTTRIRCASAADWKGEESLKIFTDVHCIIC